MNKVLVDTSIWIDYFKQGDSETAQTLSDLLKADQVVTAGVVIAELLQGAKSDKQVKELESLYEALPVLLESEKTWLDIGKMARSLRESGIIAPLTDLLLAQLAIENNCQLFSRDHHFDQIPDLPRFKMRL